MQETVTEHQVNEMLQLADLDKDGKINYEGMPIYIFLFPVNFYGFLNLNAYLIYILCLF